MKKILLLGGSHFQVPSVKAAKRLGYYAVTCDYLPDNPGHRYADEYYNVSTTDKDAVLKLAQSLGIDGIVCYASDPAAPTAAYVAEKMGLPGQPSHAVDILANKDMFRAFLSQNGFRVPFARGYEAEAEARLDWERFQKPVMVKPVDSSGSKGVTKISRVDELSNAVRYALGFSRSKRFIVEEYLEKFGYQIAGDGFSVDGRLAFRSFANEHFNLASGNPFVPVGESWPYNMPERVHRKIHDEIQRALVLLGMKTGAYNFDVRIDAEINVFLMEIGPRNGGNLIPQVTQYATGVDMVEYTIQAAMGLDCSSLAMKPVQGFWSSYMVHSKKPGILRSVVFSEAFRNNHLVEFEMMAGVGEKVDAFNGSNGTLGTMILKFASMDEMLHMMDHMDDYVTVNVE